MTQADLICSQCPLTDCDEGSLFCLYRFLTDPNDAQKAFLPLKRAKTPKKLTKNEYNRLYYRLNKEKLLNYHKERYQKLTYGNP